MNPAHFSTTALQSSKCAGYLLTTLGDNLAFPAASTLVEVLYAAMDSPDHCRYILSGVPQPEGYKKLSALLSLQKAFKTPGDLQHMSGQLTVAACMAQMYSVDMDDTKSGDTGMHCAAALTEGVFDSIFNLIQTAVLVGLLIKCIISACCEYQHL